MSTDFPLVGKEYEEIVIDEKYPEKIQIRLCAVGDQQLCGPYIEAQKGEIRFRVNICGVYDFSN